MINPERVVELLTDLGIKSKWDFQFDKTRSRCFILPGKGRLKLLNDEKYTELYHYGEDFCEDCRRGEFRSGEEAMAWLEKEAADVQP